MQYAPIIIFAFNRLEALKNTVASLLQNSEAVDSDLYVFVDGARPQKEGEQEKVHAVQKYVKDIEGFKSLRYSFSDNNKGLGPSIIAGVTDIIRQYGRVIVIEDDLIVQSNFLSFMNQGLDMYEQETKVFSVCGYTNKINIPNEYDADCYFCTRSSSWGWATWKDRWQSVDWKLEPFDDYKKHAHHFNLWGGSDCWKMLNDWHNGKNKSWAIRFCFAEFLQEKVSLFPGKSLLRNEGFDGDGTNCKKWSRFKFELEPTGKKEFAWPKDISINKYLYKQVLRYHTIPIRMYSKLMYLTHR